MKKIEFNKLEDIFLEIKNHDYDRNFASIIGMSFIVNENKLGDYFFKFNESNLEQYSFLFYYLDLEVLKLSDQEFKSLINDILLLNLNEESSLKIKKILYKKELHELDMKYKKGFISSDIYHNQRAKYLS
jgi:hypothetical protein